MFDLKSNKGVVVGYDLSDEYAQISYCRANGADMGTVSTVPDKEQYAIPMCLFKRNEVNQWFAGAEAVSYSEMDEGELVWNLWSRAIEGKPVTVAGEEFDPLSLITLYVKRTMNVLTRTVNGENVIAIMFTVPKLTKRAIEVLHTVASSLEYKDIEVSYLGREESIYHYVINQERELWKYDVMIYECRDNELDCYRFYENKITKPVVAFVDRFSMSLPAGPDEEKDKSFLSIVHDTTSGRVVTCGYLIGEGFTGRWCVESLKELCRNRRIFRGNNLYSRGACYAMLDRLTGKKPEEKATVFLGEDKLKSNIGMDVVRAGKESYLALLNGGENWFDSKKSVDLIIDRGNSFTVTITPLDGRNVRKVEIVLDGLKDHEPKTVRIRVEALMESEERLRLNVTDMGFGDFFPGSDQLFTQIISLSEADEPVSDDPDTAKNES